MYMDTPEGYEEYQKAHTYYDMLKGDINRIFVTDDKEELPRLYEGAKYYLDLIYAYGHKRMDWKLSERSERKDI